MIAALAYETVPQEETLTAEIRAEFHPHSHANSLNRP